MSVRDVISLGGRWTCPADGAEMLLVRAGPFFMGRAAGDIFAPDAERPGHTVSLRGFLMDRAPVTNERFARFMAAGGYVDPHRWSPAGWAWRVAQGVDTPRSLETPGFDGPTQPVSGVSWYEAEAYARWAGKILPTEAQWEKAARGTDGRPFPWGDDLPRSALLNFDSRIGRTTPVGTYPAGASPYGFVDMAGNVNNWCRDWYWSEFYAYRVERGLLDDPCLDDALRAEVSLPLRTRSDRGGGFATPFACFEVVATTGRIEWPPGARELWHGFRCVLEL